MRLEDWIPKTELGKKVFKGDITSLEEIFSSGKKIKEPEIVDKLLPNLRNEVIFIGGSSGKGGGKRRTPTKRTTRVHRSGRKYKISALVAVGNEDGFFGIGKAESKEHRTAIQKALEIAKLNLIPVRRGCGSWECVCDGNHSIPFEIEGSSGSMTVVLKPAPKGIGLCVNDEAKKLIRLAGIKDLWSKTFNTSSKTNYPFAIFDAFKKMNKTIVKDEMTLKKPEKVDIVTEVAKMEEGTEEKKDVNKEVKLEQKKEEKPKEQKEEKKEKKKDSKGKEKKSSK